MENKIDIFICYAHKDEKMRQKLVKQLRSLQRQGLIDLWYDHNISAGSEWEREINTHLNAAQIILLLVSPDFMDSDYSYSIEMQIAIQRHQEGEARVIPVILRPVYWQEAPFGKLQVLPTDGNPVAGSGWHSQDEAFLDVALGIRKAIESFAVPYLPSSRETPSSPLGTTLLDSHILPLRSSEQPLESTVVEVGKAIAKSILKAWTKDSEICNDTSSSLIALLGHKTSDVLAQRKGNRQFEEIGDKISESLGPLLKSEEVSLEENERSAVAIAVAETLCKTKLSIKLLAKRNLQPEILASYILTANSDASRDFNVEAKALYERLIKESCMYVVDIASQLPSFKENTFADVLKREDKILARANSILADLQRIRQDLRQMIEIERFEVEYRQAVARNLDVLQLIGTDISLPNRRYRLSTAYITLAAKQEHSSDITVAGLSTEEDKKISTAVDDVLAASSLCLLIQGRAGSGKTTLLQWIAVRAATKSFKGKLSRWNGSIPFYIRLRQYAQSTLPGPEEFVNFAAPMIANTMPKGWVHSVLRSSHAIVLIDGVDELSRTKRDEMQSWLKDLLSTHQHNKRVHFIITSRPHAIERGWMNHEVFTIAELQEMSLSDIYSFVEHWHNAIQEEVITDEEKKELRPLVMHLKEQIARNRAIRTLATNPLLCAMLCALNRERSEQLPLNRIELYEACCSMLLDRRDKESRVDISDYPTNLHYSQKLRLLGSLAYGMVKGNLSEIALKKVDATFTQKLANMPNVGPNVSGKAVRRLFVERAGILREPGVGRIDFAHRTFQEFFAAYVAMNARVIDSLIANAHNDQWHELIILAAGLAPHRVDCERLVRGLIVRGDNEKEKERRYQLHLIAVSCLETVAELGQEVKRELDERLSQLIPPREMVDAQALAAAGDLAARYLMKKEDFPVATMAMCVRTLAAIGSELALAVVEGYMNIESPIVIDELVKAWDSFDREIFAERILSQTLRNKDDLSLNNLPSLDGFQHFTHLTTLSLTNCRIDDLTPLAHLTQLTTLSLTNCRIDDLTPLAHLTQLTTLSLTACGIDDLTPLAHLTQLTTLSLTDECRIDDLTPLAHLTQLTTLSLTNCEQIDDLTPLARLTQLTALQLKGFPEVSDLSPLAGLTQLTTLQLEGFPEVSDLSPLAGLIQLTELSLAGHSISDADRYIIQEGDLVEQDSLDLSPLACLRHLISLDLSYCSQVHDLDALAKLNNLQFLRLYNLGHDVTIPEEMKKVTIFYGGDAGTHSAEGLTKKGIRVR